MRNITYRHVNVLNKFVASYNDSGHSSTEMARR